MEIKIKVDVSCKECGTARIFKLDEDRVMHWRIGSLIENVFPELSFEDLDWLALALCPCCTKVIA